MTHHLAHPRRRAAGVVLLLLAVVVLLRPTGGAVEPRGDRRVTATSSPSTAADRREIAPPDAGSSPDVAASPRPMSSRGPLVRVVPARARSARGSLVVGFPVRAVPVPVRSTVETSSVSPSRGRLQVALTGTTRAAPESVLGFYGVELARRGFASRPVPAAGGSTAVGYRHGLSSLVVTVTALRGGTAYTVLGTLGTKAG